MIVQITQNQTAKISQEDSDIASMKWQFFKDGYAKRKFNVGNGQRINRAMHIVIFERVIGRKLIQGEIVDHIDGNRLNNQRENLRLADASENAANKRCKVGKSGYKGVRSSGKLFYAQLTFRGVTWKSEKFATAELAYAAYCSLATQIHGQFAYFEKV